MSDEMDFSEEFMKLHQESRFTRMTNDDYIHSDEDDTHVIIKKKKKKKEKKPFNDDKLNLLLDDIEVKDEDVNDDDLDDYLFTKKVKKGKKRELFDVKESKKKRKKNLEAKFNPELISLKKILKDSDATVADIQEILSNIKNSKSRYVGKTLTDLLQALNTANNTRAGVVRDIANIKKSIVDLTLKQEKNNPKKKDEDDEDLEEQGVNFFRSILGNNRKQLIDSAKDYFNNSNQEQSVYDGDDDYDPNDDIEKRLQNEGNDHRSADGNAYIEYENMRPSDCIIYHGDGSWETDAVDGNMERMPDNYPRLDKDSLGNVSFNMEDNIATDEKGRRFRIIQQ